MSVRCGRCGEENPETARFCARCHTPLRYTCPGCGHEQGHGGSCDACGLDFAKYAALGLARMKVEAERERARIEQRNTGLRRLLLLLTGGLSFFGYFRRRR